MNKNKETKLKTCPHVYTKGEFRYAGCGIPQDKIPKLSFISEHCPHWRFRESCWERFEEKEKKAPLTMSKEPKIQTFYKNDVFWLEMIYPNNGVLRIPLPSTEPGHNPQEILDSGYLSPILDLARIYPLFLSALPFFSDKTTKVAGEIFIKILVACQQVFENVEPRKLDPESPIFEQEKALNEFLEELRRTCEPFIPKESALVDLKGEKKVFFIDIKTKIQ